MYNITAMEGEFNNFNINNTPITFSVATNNIATSDELSAALCYQDKQGTEYSKKKATRAKKIVATTGIALLLTTAAIRTGTVLTNGFVLNPPVVNNENFVYEDGTFKFSFSLENKQKYRVTYYITVNEVIEVKEDCSEAGDYNGEFSDLLDGERGVFYVEFTNNVDYKKRIKTVRFTTKGVSL